MNRREGAKTDADTTGAGRTLTEAGREARLARGAGQPGRTHVLVTDDWEGASLRAAIERAVAPHAMAEVDETRFRLTGPDARLHRKVASTWPWRSTSG